MKSFTDIDANTSTLKRLKVKDGSIKFYNYTPPSVKAYVTSQGIPQKIISNKTTSNATPASVSTLARPCTPGRVSKCVSLPTPVGPRRSVIPVGKTTMLSMTDSMTSGKSTSFHAAEISKELQPPMVVGTNRQNTPLFSKSIPTSIAPRSANTHLASALHTCKISTHSNEDLEHFTKRQGNDDAVRNGGIATGAIAPPSTLGLAVVANSNSPGSVIHHRALTPSNVIVPSGFIVPSAPTAGMTPGLTTAGLAPATPLLPGVTIAGSLTVSISRPTVLNSNMYERNTTGFPYSQQITINPTPEVIPTASRSLEETEMGSRQMHHTSQALQESDGVQSVSVPVGIAPDAIRVHHLDLDMRSAAHTPTAFHSLTFPNSTKPAVGKAARSNISAEPKKWLEADSELVSVYRLDSKAASEAAPIVNISGTEPLDLSKRAIESHQLRYWSDRKLDNYADESSKQGGQSKEDRDSEALEDPSSTDNSEVFIDVPDKDSSDDVENDAFGRPTTFLGQMIAVPSPPGYSAALTGERSRNKSKRKAKSRYYCGKRKRPSNQHRSTPGLPDSAE